MDEENMEQQERIKDERQRGRQFREAGRTENGWEERGTAPRCCRGPPRGTADPQKTTRLVPRLALQASRRGAASPPPPACLNNRTISENPADPAEHPRKRNKLDPT
jgi:hypothetical protein